MRVLIRLVFPAVLLALGGCGSTVAQTDAVSPPPAAKPAPAPDAVPAALDRPQYKELITIEHAVTEALEHNRVVILARVNQAISGTFRKESRSAMLPAINARFSWFRRDTPPLAVAPELGVSFTVGPKDQGSIDVAMDFPILAFGKYLNAYRAAKLVEQQAGAETETTESDIAAAVTAAAFDLLETKEGVVVAKDNEEAFAQQVKDAQALKDAGRVTAEAVLEAEVEHDVAQRQKERLESLIPIRRMVLNRLLGRPVGFPTEVVDDPVMTPPVWTLEAVMEEAIDRRPELRAARYSLDASKRNYKSVYGGELGELRGRLGYAVTDNDFQNPKDFGFLELAFDLPIWTGGGRNARIERARQEVEAARLVQEDLLEEVKTDVTSAHRDVSEAHKDIVVAKRSIERQEESLRIQREKFNSGRATSQDVLRTTATLSEARFGYVQALYGYNVALRDLHRARGADPATPVLPVQTSGGGE